MHQTRFYLLASLLLATCANMLAQCRSDVLLTTLSNGSFGPAIGATVRVCSPGATGSPCTPLATLYTDQTLATVQPTNPLTADSYGNFTICVSTTSVYLETTYKGTVKVQPTYITTGGVTSPQVIQTTGNTPLTVTSPDAATTLGFVMANGTNPVLNSSTGVIGINTLSVQTLAGTGNSCLQANASGAVSRTGATCTTSALISTLGPAASGNVINNASFQQNWNWSFSGASQAFGLALYESPLSTSTANNNALLALQTASNSTVRPIQAFTRGGAAGFYVSSTGDITASGAATFIGPHRLPAILSANVLGTDASGNIIVGTGGGGGGMVYPAAGIANSTGTAWGTSYSAGNQIPATFIPTLNQSTTGNAATATALATSPGQCSGGQFSVGITANGSANCANLPATTTSWSSLTPPTSSLSLSMVGNTTLWNVDASAVGGHDAFAISEVGPSAPANSVLLGLFAKNISMSPLQAETTSGTGGFSVNGQLGDIDMIGSSKLVGPVQMPGLVSATSLATDVNGNIVAGAGGGITSINSNTNPAQLIHGGTGINVVSASGTTTVNWAGVPRTCTDGGTAGAVLLTCTPSTSGFGAYTKGESFTFFPAVNSTGAATINIDGRGSATLTSLPSPLASTNPNLNTAYFLTVSYDGTRFSVGCPIQTNPTGAGTANSMVLTLGTVGASGNCPLASGWVATNFALGALNGAIATTIGSGGTAMNATVQPVTFSPANVSGGGGAFLGGNVLLKGGDNNNTGTTETAGNLEIRPGTLGNFPTTTTANGGELAVEVGALATTGFTQGQAACISASASSAGAVGRYAPCTTANDTKWIGTFSQATSASSTATFVQVNGDAPFWSAVAATWTAGDYICVDTGNASAFVNSTSTACTAGLQAGIVSFTDASAVSTHYGVIARR